MRSPWIAVLVASSFLAACGSDDEAPARPASYDAGLDVASDTPAADVVAEADVGTPDTTSVDAPHDALSESTSDGTAEAAAEAGQEGSTTLSDPAVFQTQDALVVCEPTAAAPCTPSDMTWVGAEYGSVVERADAAKVQSAGQVFRLVALVEREGPSNIDVFVADMDGSPLSGVPIAFYFSSAPDASRPDEWYPVKVTGVTEASGRVGFALTSSAYLDTCGGGGPHAIWVSAPGAAPDTTVPSDLADHLGMLGGTNHRHLDLLFQRTDVSGQPADAVRCPL